MINLVSNCEKWEKCAELFLNEKEFAYFSSCLLLFICGCSKENVLHIDKNSYRVNFLMESIGVFDYFSQLFPYFDKVD